MNKRGRGKRARARRLDSTRRLDLLWGSAGRSARGPKPGLRIEQVVSVAIAIADREGLGAVTMRRIADDLGFTTMALYRYVPGKDELIDLMADTAIGLPPLPNEGKGDWAAALREWARADLAVYKRHPWLLQLVGRIPQGPNWFAWVDAALNPLAGSGLTAGESLAMVTLIDNHVRGAAQIYLASATSAQETGKPDEWSAAFTAALERVAGDGRYPTLSRIIATGGFNQGPAAPADDHFAFGLERLLDGIAAYISARSTPRRSRTTSTPRRR